MVMRGYGRETYGREKRQLRKVANEIKKGAIGWTNNWCSVCFIWGMIERESNVCMNNRLVEGGTMCRWVGGWSGQVQGLGCWYNLLAEDEVKRMC